MNYEELLEKAKEIYESKDTPHFFKAWLLANIICPTNMSIEDDVKRRSTTQAFKYARSLDTCNQYSRANIDRLITWLENQDEPKDKGEISDGFHTFNELYRYRMLYNAAFFNLLPKEWVHKSKRHHDGEECFGGGWFIVMANLPTGQISNHYELKDWDLFDIPEKDVADEWDGHTPQDVANRLNEYLLEKQGEPTRTNIEIPFGANDSELQEVSYDIPEGFYAEIKDDRVVIKKFEPKFHKEDWIIHQGTENIYQVIARIDNQYQLKYGDNYTIQKCADVDRYARLWTIQDAKDGDVLVTTSIRSCPFIYRKTDYNNNLAYFYAGIDSDDNFQEGCIKRTLFHFGSVSNVVPATKEQRDLLFQKMKESGWEWDVEKKELKKIETQDNQVINEIIKNQKEIPSEFAKLVHDNFWDLVKTENKMLNADDVIEWFRVNCWNSHINPIDKFKKDFGLMTLNELQNAWVRYRGEAHVTTEQMQAVSWAWQQLQGKSKLNADEVIEWIDKHVPTKFEDMANYVEDFKQHFRL